MWDITNNPKPVYVYIVKATKTDRLHYKYSTKRNSRILENCLSVTLVNNGCKGGLTFNSNIKPMTQTTCTRRSNVGST